MRYISLFLLVPLIMAFANKEVTIGRVFVYKKFLKSGSRGSVANAFHHPDGNSQVVDTTRTLMKGVNWIKILSNAERVEGYPILFAGISFAGEMYVNGKIHFIVFCAPVSLVDVTAHKWYHTDPQHTEALTKYYTNTEEE